MIDEHEFAYSLNEEDFHGTFPTREDAADEAEGEARCDKRTEFWTARIVPFVPTLDALWVIDRLRDDAYELVADHAEGWLDKVTPEQEADLTARLTATIGEWIAAHGHAPRFFSLDDYERHEVPIPAPAVRPEGLEAPRDCTCPTLGGTVLRHGDDCPLSRDTGGAPSEDGVALIAKERARQKKVEGWTPEHDDAHRSGEMATAAALYITHADRADPPVGWPWSRAWWKPKDRVRNLVRAGALIAAEIDRLNRSADHV